LSSKSQFSVWYPTYISVIVLRLVRPFQIPGRDTISKNLAFARAVGQSVCGVFRMGHVTAVLCVPANV
jgi:hypothetical protein